MNYSKLRSMSLFFSASFLAVSCFSAAYFIFNKSEADSHETKATQTVEEYYADVDTSSASALLSSLQTLTNTGFVQGSYAGLWTTYASTDIGSDGYVTDIYSNSTSYTITTDQCGNYSSEGNCYNREHSTPKSWWGGDDTLQGSDPFIVYPSDGKVNGYRSNYPFGEVGSATYSSNNSYSLLGTADTSTYSYSGTVFEPNDDWKGDLARSAFYTRAKWTSSYSWTAGEGSAIYSGSASTNYGLTDYAIALYTAWSNLDPVDDWELQRNEAVYAIQGDRNPFINHPEYANTIWGGTTYTGGTTSTAPNTITVTPSSSSIAVGGTASLTASVDTGSTSVTWSSSNSSVATVSSSGVVTGVAAGTATITATSTVDTSVSGSASVTVKTLSSLSKSGTPSTVSYSAGESFDATGLTITATYSDSSTANITSSVVWTPNPLTSGTTSVTGTYGGMTVSVSGLTVTAIYTATINKTNTTVLSTTAITADTSQDYTITDGTNSAGTINILWGTGALESSSYDEIGLPSSTGKVSGNDSTYVKTLTIDLYKYDNITVYADGSAVTETIGTSTSNKDSLVHIYEINSSTWYIQDTSTSYTQYFYSIELEVDLSSSVAVTGVSLDTSTLSLIVGNNSTLTATISPTDATNQNVTWSTNNSSVATVSGGVVTAVAAGTATITVTTSDGSYTDTCAVTVSELTLASLAYSGTLSDSSYFTGESFDATGLTVTATYSNSSTADVTSSVIWTPNPLTAGTTSVTGSYTSGGVTKTVTVTGITVSDPVLSSISTSGQTTAYSVGGTFSYDGTCTATYTDNSTATVTPTVDSSLADMNTAGTYTISLSFTSGGVTKTTSYSITVTDAANISGTYTLTSNATTYTAATDAASAEACIDGLDSALTVTAQDNMRFYGAPVTTDMMFGGSKTGASLTIDTTDSNYVVSKIVVKCESYLSTNISTVVCAGMSKEVSNYYDGSSSNYADYTFYPLSNSFTISTLDSNKRIFVNSIEATIVPLSSAADAYGELFNDTTATECAALSGISDTNWTLLTTVYSNADSTIQTSIVNTTADASGSAIQQAMYRYDMIVAKYSATNFLGRSTSSQSTSVLANNSAMYIIVFLLVGVGSFAGISYLLKKKKYH
ncbi:MAG: endonuclease [Erysipelotrichaceae bacterium]|nr:endonuclease [Erysipelotrichaceae bacterium]